MTALVCTAVTAIALGTPCGADSTTKVTARCEHGHTREGLTCDRHVQQMRRGLTYCTCASSRRVSARCPWSGPRR
ncbi:hypothetical protein SAMN05421874_12863 [Nonomuraea maritima]|uniref:Uncharacterized protein n=1 Tax=Nonomuraea maritima TaxID=683260 RepID=A0A1G9MJR2_9ACTN|nr:hypothetical protein SAMN05421874_12863 [Nonomuraea maritima]